ncbi:hypothetical protein CIT31_14415 [Mesorhizobium wenxiniae]|uniref:Uncharacterized protein n=1 Tax=Mesorhizobium wenxiniae TaxID=2014805 RepID=A0A271KJR8_9HYPH|nr:hypothetical protein CIT31_14415 [Mesorhizobium wenxiniae]
MGLKIAFCLPKHLLQHFDICALSAFEQGGYSCKVTFRLIQTNQAAEEKVAATAVKLDSNTIAPASCQSTSVP